MKLPKEEKLMRIKNKFVYLLIPFLLLASCMNLKGNNGLLTPKIETIEELKINKYNQQSTYVDVYDKTIKSVVSVISYDKTIVGALKLKGIGSGVIYKEDSNNYYIMTNHHVITGAGQINVMSWQKQEIKATVLGYDSLQDLAILSVAKNKLSKVEVAQLSPNFALPVVGEEVAVIGNPASLTYQGTMNVGIVAGIERILRNSTTPNIFNDLHLIQVNVATNPGNSGGPLFNLKGEVIGINQIRIISNGIESTEGLNFSLPIHDMYIIGEKIIDSYNKNEDYLYGDKVNRASFKSDYKFKNLSEMTLKERKEAGTPSNLYKGVVLIGKIKNSTEPLDSCLEGSVIVGINEHKVENIVQFRWYLYECEVGQEIVLHVYKKTSENQNPTSTTEVKVILENIRYGG